MSKLYLECYSGISGDMTVGALLDLGADKEKLLQVLSTVPADGYEIKITTVQKSMINACDFDVVLDAAHENHDHDMAYLYGSEEEVHGAVHEHAHDHAHDHGDHEHTHDHEHDHGDHEHAHDHAHDHGDHEHTHDHAHHHEHAGHSHAHVHRNLADVYEIIDKTEMTEGAREMAKKIFAIVADAESEVHGKPLSEVHFHEVGAIDSIIDVIAIAVCYDDLKEKEHIDEVIVSALYEGHGTVRTQHGLLPIPVPAVAAIARNHQLRMHLMSDEGEFVTPTGAAAVAALRTSDKLPSEYIVKRTGLGAGKREHKRAGVVRAMLIEE